MFEEANLKKSEYRKKNQTVTQFTATSKNQIDIDFNKIKLTMNKMTKRKAKQRRRAKDNDEKTPENEDLSRSDPL